MSFSKKIKFEGYDVKCNQFEKKLDVKDFLAPRVGIIIYTSIFILSSSTAVNYVSPAVVFSFLLVAYILSMYDK